MRVGVHIACICEKKGVDIFMTRTRSYTIDCIYLYFMKILKLIDKWFMDELYKIYPNLTAHMKKDETSKRK